MTARETIEVLDWALAAACLQVTCEPRRTTLDKALASHFDYLRTYAPLSHVAVMALLDAGDRLANDDVIRAARGGR